MNVKRHEYKNYVREKTALITYNYYSLAEILINVQNNVTLLN